MKKTVLANKVHKESVHWKAESGQWLFTCMTVYVCRCVYMCDNMHTHVYTCIHVDLCVYMQIHDIRSAGKRVPVVLLEEGLNT